MTMELKLGKRPASVDVRTLKLKAILKTLPPLPTTYDIDSRYPFLKDDFMFKNNQYGDCVIAQHAHQLLRFESFEQEKQIAITDKEVTDEYFKETGGPDVGLSMLGSLNVWRHDGFLVGGKIYKIHAFASIDWKNHNEVMAGIMLFNGVCFGMLVPQSAMDQFNSHQPWVVVNDDGGIVGGHAVYALKWLMIDHVNEIGPVILTWGGYVQATWAFWDKYVDEAYVIIDERDDWVTDSPLDIPKLEQYLSEIEATPSQSMTVTTLSLPIADVGKPYSVIFNVYGGTPPYTWRLTSGTLPDGVIFIDGVLKGIPTKVGIYANLLFMANDSVGNGTGVILTMRVQKKCWLLALLGK